MKNKLKERPIYGKKYNLISEHKYFSDIKEGIYLGRKDKNIVNKELVLVKSPFGAYLIIPIPDIKLKGNVLELLVDRVSAKLLEDFKPGAREYLTNLSKKLN